MADTSNKRRWRIWITLSELVGVLALAVAGLNLWDAHRDRLTSERREAQAEQSQASAAEARASFVLIARTEPDGARLTLQPMSADQAIQSQRLVFPTALGLAPVDTVQPRLDRDALAAGLRREVAAERKARQAGRSGEGEAPVGVVSSYIEAGELRNDASIYRVTYAWTTPFIGGPRFRLEGAVLARRGVKGDLQRAVDALWARDHPAD